MVFVLTSVFLSLFFFRFLLFDSQEVNVYLTVSDVAGFNLDPDALYLGSVQPGQSVSRHLVIENLDCRKCLVNIRGEGDLIKWLVISSNNIKLLRGERRNVNVAAFVPVDAQYGNYSATLKISFWKTF